MRHRLLHGARLLLLLVFVSSFVVSIAGSASAQDSDGDGVMDDADNCIDVPNGPTIPDFGGNIQRNTDQDVFGNACDADLNDDGTVDLDDLTEIATVFFTADPDGDMNGDGVVDFLDLALMGAAFGDPPGPACCDPGVFAGVVCDDVTPDSECTVELRGIEFVTTRQRISRTSSSAGLLGNPLPGIMITDDIRVTTPFGELTLVEATFTLIVGSGGDELTPFDSVVGTVRVPFPDIGFMAGVTIDQVPMAAVGIDLGANIDLGVPLIPDVQYMFFNYGSGFGASLGPVSFSVGGANATILLNPFDPFFFLGGSLDGLLPGGGSLNAPEEFAIPREYYTIDRSEDEEAIASGIFVEPEFGIGVSIGGQIPFEPIRSCMCAHDLRVTGARLDPNCNACVASICSLDSACCNSSWDQRCVNEVSTICDDYTPEFLGHLLVKAPIPIGTLPLELSGIAIANIDPEGDGTIFQGDPDFQLGANGVLAVGVPFLSFFDFGFDLGDATTTVEYVGNDVAACFDGLLDPDDPFAMFPPSFPIPISNPAAASATVVGKFDTGNPSSAFLRAEGGYSIDLGGLNVAGVSLGEMASGSASILVNEDGLRFSGMTQTQLVPNFTNSELSMAVTIPADNLLEASAELGGALTVVGLGLDPANILIGPLGFAVDGTLNLQPLATVAMGGGIGIGGLMMTGSFASQIDFNLQSLIDDVLFTAIQAVQIAQDAIDVLEGVQQDCKDLCEDLTGFCYLNPCCGLCEVAFDAAIIPAELALFLAEEALGILQVAVTAFFNVLPFPIAGSVGANIDVSIDDLDISGEVSATFFGVGLGGRAEFFPPLVCITLPLGIFDAGGTLGLGDEEFCLPPF